MRDIGVWVVAVLLSLVAHATLFIKSGGENAAQSPQAKQPAVTRLNFAQSRPVAEVPRATPEKKTQKKEPPVKPQEKKPPPKKEVRGKAQQKHAEQVKPPVEPPTPPPQSAPLQTQAAAPAINPGLVADEKQKYLAQLMQHIDSHKFYSPVAKRRGIQGVVKVSFRMLAVDRIENLLVSGGPSVLRKAAEKTVQQALPFPVPPEIVSLPLDLEYDMEFVLK